MTRKYFVLPEKEVLLRKLRLSPRKKLILLLILLVSAVFLAGFYLGKKHRKFNEEEDLWMNEQLRFRFGNFYGRDTKRQAIIDQSSQAQITHPVVSQRTKEFKEFVIDLIGYIPPILANLGDLADCNDFFGLPNGQNGTERLPIITFNRKFGNRDCILWKLNTYNDPQGLVGYMSPDFDSKKPILFWRGHFSGPDNKPTRLDVISLIFNQPNVDVGFLEFPNEPKRPQLAPYLKDEVPQEDFFKYKYILCLEGNDVSTLFPKVLASQSLAFHPIPFHHETIIFTSLKPNVHFIAIKPDGSDIIEKISWCEAHPEKAREIVKNANEYMKYFLDQGIHDELHRRTLERYIQSLI